MRLYRLVAAHLAGRREFGTYAPLADAAGGLVAHLRAPQQPVLLEDLFLLADGFRVGAALARVYPGLAREQQAPTALLLDRYAAGSLLAYGRYGLDPRRRNHKLLRLPVIFQHKREGLTGSDGTGRIRARA